MKISFLLTTLALVLGTQAFAHPEPHPAAMPKEFTTLSSLVGTWDGTGMMQGKETAMTVEYKLSSGGTVLIETLFPGTPHEMVSVYHRSGKTIAMTHYCAMGNQPEMMLRKATDKSLAFELTKPVGISSLKEMHMHALKLTLADADSLTQEWTNFMDGKPGETAVFKFKRKK